MFKREKKVYLSLTGEERRFIRDVLMQWRNRLISQGKEHGPVDELLLKLM